MCNTTVALYAEDTDFMQSEIMILVGWIQCQGREGNMAHAHPMGLVY